MLATQMAPGCAHNRVFGVVDSEALERNIGGIGTATPAPQACFSTKQNSPYTTNDFACSDARAQSSAAGLPRFPRILRLRFAYQARLKQMGVTSLF